MRLEYGTRIQFLKSDLQMMILSVKNIDGKEQRARAPGAHQTFRLILIELL